jgi:hypothetical protein
MTKKDFELIAATIAKAFNADRENLEHAAFVFEDALSATNPKFDRERFLRACGIEA